MIFNKNLWGALRFAPKTYSNVLLATFFLNLLTLALPIFTRNVYDKVVPNFAEATLWVLFSGIILALVFEVVFKSTRYWIGNQMGASAINQMEKDFFSHLLAINSKTNISQANLFLSNLSDVQDFFCQKLLPTLVDVPFVIIFFVIIYMISPAMMLVPLGVGIVMIGMQYARHNHLNAATLANQMAQQEKMNTLSESLNGRETIRQLATYTPFINKWVKIVHNAAFKSADSLFSHQLVASLGQSLFALNSVLLMVVGVYEIHGGELSIGGLIAINMLSARALSPLMGIGELLAKWPKLKKEILAVEKFMDLPSENDDCKDTFPMRGAIYIERVTATLNKVPILRECTWKIVAGQKWALIGRSGAGKSTLLNLLALEVPIQSGRLMWDDRDSNSISPAGLRSQIGIVEQHPYFFTGTLRDNLSMGAPCDDPELRTYLEIVGLDLFIRAMGRGLDLPLVEGGINLSGGQRQALAIARALSRKPKVVFMDEPTAMMDHAMEQLLVQNLRFALKDKTCIIITHRSPLLSVVDGIAMMEEGRIVKAGNRNDMLKELGNVTS